MERNDMEAFRSLLMKLRRRLMASVSYMHREALEEGGRNQKELSDITLEHLAERGTDTFERDLMLGILQSNEIEIADIDNALAKIDEGIYGVCEECQSEISAERLKAIPFARMCIGCKKRDEQEGDQG